LIERDGQELMTGGFIITDTPQIRGILDDLPITMQYDFVCDFKKKTLLLNFTRKIN
jgi:hypothetical protein